MISQITTLITIHIIKISIIEVLKEIDHTINLTGATAETEAQAEILIFKGIIIIKIIMKIPEDRMIEMKELHTTQDRIVEVEVHHNRIIITIKMTKMKTTIIKVIIKDKNKIIKMRNNLKMTVNVGNYNVVIANSAININFHIIFD